MWLINVSLFFWSVFQSISSAHWFDTIIDLGFVGCSFTCGVILNRTHHSKWVFIRWNLLSLFTKWNPPISPSDRKTLPQKLCIHPLSTPMALTHHVQCPPLPCDWAFCSLRGSAACIYRLLFYEKSEQKQTPTPKATSPPKHKVGVGVACRRVQIECDCSFTDQWWEETKTESS